MPSPKLTLKEQKILTPAQAEILARLTRDWQAEWRIAERNLRNCAALWDLVERGHAERRPDFAFGYDYRLKGDDKDAS